MSDSGKGSQTGGNATPTTGGSAGVRYQYNAPNTAVRRSVTKFSAYADKHDATLTGVMNGDDIQKVHQTAMNFLGTS